MYMRRLAENNDLNLKTATANFKETNAMSIGNQLFSVLYELHCAEIFLVNTCQKKATNNLLPWSILLLGMTYLWNCSVILFSIIAETTLHALA